MKLGIIGFGNIGKLLFENLININFNHENVIYLSNKTKSKLNHLNDIGSSICVCENNVELAKNSDIIIICVKSPQLLNVIEEIGPHINEDVQIIHTCAGIDFSQISEVYDGPISCIIPSIASAVVENTEKSGISIFYNSSKVNERKMRFVEETFSKFSYIKTADSFEDLKFMTIATSCLPAFIAQSIEVFSNIISDYSDLSSKDFEEMLNETVYSTVNLLNTKTFTEKEIMEMVATKKGITQKGLDYLECELPVVYRSLVDKLI